MKRFDVLVVGDINIDIIVEGCESFPLPGEEVRARNISANIGGGAALCAMGLGKLGVRSLLYGFLGNDLYSLFVREQLKEYNVEPRYLKTSSNSNTGMSIILSDEKGKSFITCCGSNAELELDDIDIEIIENAKHIHVTGYKGSKNHDKYMKFVNKLKLFETTVSTDFRWDDSNEWYEGVYEFISKVDVCFMNDIEAVNYTKSIDIETSLDKLSKYCNNVVIKMGDKGAAARWNGETRYQKAYPVKVVDTTGAGDSFNAGYLYGFIRDKSLEECLTYGNACGALSVTKNGGNAAFPTKAEFKSFIKTVSKIL